VSWDLALDASGDVIFSPTLDLLGSTGDGLTKQRILIRCRVPRGSWAWDEDNTFGSRLAAISRNPSPQQLAQAPALVREALEPMTDISIDDVQVAIDDENRLVVSVTYTNIFTDDEADSVPADDVPIDATVTV